MKIGLLLPSILISERYKDRIFAPGELFSNLAQGLINHKHEVTIYKGNKILQNDDFPSVKENLQSAKIKSQITFIRNQNEYEVEMVSRAVDHANKNNLDLLHVYLSSMTHYFVKYSRAPVLFTLHDPVFPQNTLEYFRLKLFSNQNYVAISQSQNNLYKKLLGINCIATVHHGLDLKNFDFLSIPENYLSMIGRFLPEKGFDLGIKVAQKLRIPLKIVSSQNYQKTDYYLKEIKPYLDSPNISEIDFLYPAQRNLFLQKSKLFLFPIKWEEPFGMVLIESMACGTPVVAFARGSVPEIVKDGKTGFVVDPNLGFDGLCQAVQKIYSMPDQEYKQMRKACREHVEKNFTIERMVDEYEKVYKLL